MNSYWSSVEKLYGYGARKFLFLGVSAVDLSPMKISAGASSQATQKSTDIDYNNQIQSRITQFKSAHPDVTTYYYDASTVFYQVAQSPGSYGISNTNGYCSAYANSNDPNANSGSCPYPVKGYMWKDNLHPTFVVHDALGKALGSLIQW
ncbi:hypothetical protein FRC03_010257 [Tulasnella sp. 419]|nr:hypothetical protein FRC03_010257 [Tulasnella sp. 419]